MKKYFLFLLGIFLINLVTAVPSPHAFCGSVEDLDGEEVEGTIIAKMENIEVGQSEVVDGKYDLTVSSESGGIIYFYLNGKTYLANYTFEAFEITELDLIVPVHSESDSNSETELEDYCEPSWQCSGWSACYKGIMKRECSDMNHCSYSYNIPNEVSGCEVSEKVLEENETNYILFAGGILSSLLLIILLVMVVGKV